MTNITSIKNIHILRSYTITLEKVESLYNKIKESVEEWGIGVIEDMKCEDDEERYENYSKFRIEVIHSIIREFIVAPQIITLSWRYKYDEQLYDNIVDSEIDHNLFEAYISRIFTIEIISQSLQILSPE